MWTTLGPARPCDNDLACNVADITLHLVTNTASAIAAPAKVRKVRIRWVRARCGEWRRSRDRTFVDGAAGPGEPPGFTGEGLVQGAARRSIGIHGGLVAGGSRRHRWADPVRHGSSVGDHESGIGPNPQPNRTAPKRRWLERRDHRSRLRKVCGCWMTGPRCKGEPCRVSKDLNPSAQGRQLIASPALSDWGIVRAVSHPRDCSAAHGGHSVRRKHRRTGSRSGQKIGAPVHVKPDNPKPLCECGAQLATHAQSFGYRFLTVA